MVVLTDFLTDDTAMVSGYIISNNGQGRINLSLYSGWCNNNMVQVVVIGIGSCKRVAVENSAAQKTYFITYPGSAPKNSYSINKKIREMNLCGLPMKQRKQYICMAKACRQKVDHWILLYR